MVAELKKTSEPYHYYCSNCRMKIKLAGGETECYCPFCGYEWSNWEEAQHEFWELYFKDLTSTED